MLPSLRHFLGFIDLEDQFERFTRKPGAAFHFVHELPDLYTDLSQLGPRRTTWNVSRAEADEIMIRHAAKQGAKVFEETRVESIAFKNDGDPVTSRPVQATWKNKSGQTGCIKFDWLIDASGRQGIMSTKYLKNRIMRESLRNVAAYGYWEGVSPLDEGGPRANAPWFEVLADKAGWAWCIPLVGKTSIGVVMHENTSKRKKAEGPSGLEDHYLQQVKLAPGIQKLISERGTFMKGSARGTTDYSYHATSYSGDHYRLIGDAAAFVDPLFSSGYHIALTGALSAAATIISSTKGHITEQEAQAWHDAKIGIAQTRFLLIVLSAYKQMQSEGNMRMVDDVKVDDFQYAFSMFRPVYQGEHDTENQLTNEELEEMVDFTRHLFVPITAEQLENVKARKGELLSSDVPMMSKKELDEVLDEDDSDARIVLSRMSVLKMKNDTICHDSFTSDAVNGYVLNMKRGTLGLVKAI